MNHDGNRQILHIHDLNIPRQTLLHCQVQLKQGVTSRFLVKVMQPSCVSVKKFQGPEDLLKTFSITTHYSYWQCVTTTNSSTSFFPQTNHPMPNTPSTYPNICQILLHPTPQTPKTTKPNTTPPQPPTFAVHSELNRPSRVGPSAQQGGRWPMFQMIAHDSNGKSLLL